MNSSIRTGQQLIIQGTVAHITQHLEALKQIHICTEDGRHKVCNEVDFYEMYEKGDLRFVDPNPYIPKKNDPLAIMHCLPADERETIRQRKAYVEAVITEDGHWNTDSDERNQGIRLVAEQLHDLNPPSTVTIKRWYSRFRAAKSNLLALVPRESRRGNRTPRLSAAVEVAMTEAIEKFFLESGLRAKGVYQKHLPALLREKGVPTESMPSYKTFMERVNLVPAFEKSKRQKGYCTAQNEFPNGRPFQKPQFHLECAEIDHTPLDIIIVDKDGKELGRPFATFIICRKTRMILGFFLSMTSVSARNVLQAFIHSVLPKTYVRDRYPDILTDWPCFGMYHELVSDNGQDLLAEQVENALQDMGVHYIHHRKKMPRYKGIVERFMRTINEALFHCLPGTTTSNYQTLSEKQARQNACVTFEELDYMVHKWIIDDYHMSIHRDLRDTPLNTWKKSAKAFEPPCLPASYKSLAWLLMKREERKTQKDGIHLENLTYQSEALANLARRIGFGRSVNVYYDPDNISKITVIDPDTKEHIEATCVNTGYTQGQLSLKQHEMNSKIVRESETSVRKANAQHLLRVREDQGLLEMQLAEKSKLSRKRKSKRHKLDEERLKTSGTVRGVERVPPVRVTRKVEDDPTLNDIVLDFEPF